jgi:uncharacterized alpha-E superfamily protein
MLSRVAESVYWIGRYLERAENTARFIDVNLLMSLDAPITFSEQWQPVVAITGDLAPFEERYGVANRRNVIQFLASDRDNPSSIVSCVTKARENARSIREVISSEMWEQTNRFYLLVSNRSAPERAQAFPYEFFSDVKLRSHTIAGVAANTMSHGQAWQFFQLGRLLERADNMTRLLDVKYFLLLPSLEHVGGAVDEMEWSILLRSATAFEMYRKQYGRITPENVIEFLLLDKEFPRAVLFCVLGAEESLHAITGSPRGAYRNSAEQRLGRLSSELAYTQVYDIIASGLHEFLDGFQSRLNEVGSAISDTFFSLQPAASSPVLERRRLGGDVLSGDQGQRGSGSDS